MTDPPAPPPGDAPAPANSPGSAATPQPRREAPLPPPKQQEKADFKTIRAAPTQDSGGPTPLSIIVVVVVVAAIGGLGWHYMGKKNDPAAAADKRPDNG